MPRNAMQSHRDANAAFSSKPVPASSATFVAETRHKASAVLLGLGGPSPFYPNSVVSWWQGGLSHFSDGCRENALWELGTQPVRCEGASSDTPVLTAVTGVRGSRTLRGLPSTTANTRPSKLSQRRGHGAPPRPAPCPRGSPGTPVSTCVPRAPVLAPGDGFAWCHGLRAPWLIVSRGPDRGLMLLFCVNDPDQRARGHAMCLGIGTSDDFKSVAGRFSVRLASCEREERPAVRCRLR